MQLPAHFLHSEAISLLGWVLIVAGLALAVHTLVGSRRPKSGVAHILRAYRPADWSASQPARKYVRPMGPPDQWQRLTAIVESGFVHADSALELQARAILELEAVDDGLTELLAAWGQYRVTLPRLEQAPEPAIVAPTPIAQPIAA